MTPLAIFQIAISFVMFIIIGITALKNKKTALQGIYLFVLYLITINIKFT